MFWSWNSFEAAEGTGQDHTEKRRNGEKRGADPILATEYAEYTDLTESSFRCACRRSSTGDRKWRAIRNYERLGIRGRS